MLRKRASLFATIFALAVVMVCQFLPSNAVAERRHPDDTERESSDIGKMFHKLGRGVTNLLLGWIELPKNIAAEWRRTDPFTGTILGTFKGIGWTVARTFAGAYEIISFPFPVPRDYQPIMNPEFVLPTVWGDRLPLYRDEYMAASANADAAVDFGRTTGFAQPNNTEGSSITPGTRRY